MNKDSACLGVVLAVIFTSLAACQSNPSQKRHTNLQSRGIICPNAAQYQDRVVGDGHCVSLIKRCSNAPNTVEWRPGPKVIGSALTPGTIIATFANGRYPNKTGYHAAIYIRQDKQGIWVWDQWQGKSVHQRLIRIRSDNATPNNTAQDYRVVLTK